MTVKAVTAPDAARDPKHPEHARWVKERTLAAEIQHAQTIGLSARDAETANIRNLERLEARKRDAKPRTTPAKPQRREVTRADLAAANVTKRAATVRKVRPPRCNYCGVCVKCRRELRIRALINLSKTDPRAETLLWEVYAVMRAADLGKDFQDGTGRIVPISTMNGPQRRRVATDCINAVCDRSTALLGAWR